MSETDEIKKLEDVGVMTVDVDVKKKTIDTLEVYGKPAIESIAEIANMTMESEVKEYGLDAIKRKKCELMVKTESLQWLSDTHRLCECPPKKLNCLTGKEWVKCMIGVWQFTYEKRDVRDKNIHPAVFPIALVKRVIELFTHRGEVVLDCFNGVGTTLVACKDVERHGIGIDIKPEYCTFVEKRVANSTLSDVELKTEIICDDSANLREHIPEESIDLMVTSPPYASILDKERTNKSYHSKKRNNKRFGVVEQYSTNPKDLGTMSPDMFIKESTKIFREVYAVLKTDKHCVVNIRDVVPHFTHIHFIGAMEHIGFELRNIIIWDKTNLIQRMGIFGYPSNYITLNSAYEYILDFKKTDNEKET